MLRIVRLLTITSVVGFASVAIGASRAEAAELNLTGSIPTCSDSGGVTCGAAGFSTFSVGTTQFAWFQGLLWSTTNTQPTGSGYIDSFVRIQDAGPSPNNLVVDGMNTSGTLKNDEKPGPTFTHDVSTSELAKTTIGGSDYYQFLLDINQTGSDPLLTLSGLQLCTAGSGGLSYVDTCKGGSTTLQYDLNSATGPVHPETQAPLNTVLLDYRLNSGSGSGDLFVYVPTSVLPTTGASNKFLYLWSQFGLPSPYGNNDGYEEWAFRHKGSGSDEPFNQPGVPEPTTLVMLGTGLLFGAAAVRRRNRQQKAQQATEQLRS